MGHWLRGSGLEEWPVKCITHVGQAFLPVVEVVGGQADELNLRDGGGVSGHDAE